MRVWVTKYWATRGMIEADGELSPVNGLSMLMTVTSGDLVGQSYYGNEWHETYMEAVKHAALLREKKLISLRKQIDKIEAIDWATCKNGG